MKVERGAGGVALALRGVERRSLVSRIERSSFASSHDGAPAHRAGEAAHVLADARAYSSALAAVSRSTCLPGLITLWTVLAGIASSRASARSDNPSLRSFAATSSVGTVTRFGSGGGSKNHLRDSHFRQTQVPRGRASGRSCRGIPACAAGLRRRDSDQPRSLGLYRLTTPPADDSCVPGESLGKHYSHPANEGAQMMRNAAADRILGSLRSANGKVIVRI